jgi:DNA modification methylase
MHERWTVTQGDCRDVMRAMPDASVEAIVSDPPYGLAFMGKGWDHAVPGVEFWVEALRVAKPGAHLVAFGGTRTFHRLAVAVEDAGWEIRDCLSWLYGSGFPKSHNGAWGGTALKPAWEPIILARKPLTGTVAANVAQHGTGALNVDGCRVAGKLGGDPNRFAKTAGAWFVAAFSKNAPRVRDEGRWPANVCLDEDAAAMLDEPSRFFYTAKASRREREAGLDGMPERVAQKWNSGGIAERRAETARPLSNVHPTVKPIALMRWLCRLVTPPGGLILDPFTGSGTTGCAAVLEGFRFHGAELDAEYADIARRRIAYWAAHADADAKQPTQLDLAPLADADPPA